MAVCAKLNRCHWLVALAKTASSHCPGLPLSAPLPIPVIYNCSIRIYP
jgi:hypothetical protein